jgi:hypothetical protein
MLQDWTFCQGLASYGRLEDNILFKEAQEDRSTCKKVSYGDIYFKFSPAVAFLG